MSLKYFNLLRFKSFTYYNTNYVFIVKKYRKTAAYEYQDGIDFVPMPTWKTYLIQLLNIAGPGPIFGALSGAVFGPIVYIWIVLGCIFAGAVHDYLCGMLSEREKR